MRRRTALTVLAAAVTALGLMAAPAAADRRDEVDRRLAEAGEQLETLDAQADAAAAALSDARTRLPAARARLTQTQAAQAKAQEADRTAAAELTRATAAATRAEQQLAAQEERIATLRTAVGSLARAVYQQGPYAEITLLLESQDPGDFTSRLAALDAVGRANTDSLARMSAARADLALLEVKLEALRAEVQERRQQAAQRFAEAQEAAAEAATAKSEVDQLVAQRAAALQLAESRKDVVLQRYRELQQEQRRLAEEARQAALAAATGSSGVVLGGSPAGDLTWPIPGGTTSGQVGARIHPVYGYRSCHTGIDIRGGYGTPIHAAASGVVASVVNGGPYGLHTLIAHSGGLTTMYAHQSSATVSAGSSVSAGQVIGYVGSTGYSTGPHLHFEVHVGGVPYNPLGWFGGSRFAISC